MVVCYYQKGVRNIDWGEDGYYIIKDNNDEELSNKYFSIPKSE